MKFYFDKTLIIHPIVYHRLFSFFTSDLMEAAKGQSFSTTIGLQIRDHQIFFDQVGHQKYRFYDSKNRHLEF